MYRWVGHSLFDNSSAFNGFQIKGSFTIVNIYLLVQRVLILGEGGGGEGASVLFLKC